VYVNVNTRVWERNAVDIITLPDRPSNTLVLYKRKLLIATEWHMTKSRVGGVHNICLRANVATPELPFILYRQ
jgi:hypothetical protein